LRLEKLKLFRLAKEPRFVRHNAVEHLDALRRFTLHDGEVLAEPQHAQRADAAREPRRQQLALVLGDVDPAFAVDELAESAKLAIGHRNELTDVHARSPEGSRRGRAG